MTYESKLSVRETQVAIKKIKVAFEELLTERLNLTRVSAPLFVAKSSGLNDNLSGKERPVAFEALHLEEAGQVEIVHSLAKWKRQALGRYGFVPGEGLYTNMNAIRRDETLDEIHSLYVDQWDFEKVLTKEERTPEYLKGEVRKIYSIFKTLEERLAQEYDYLSVILPENLTFVTSQELYDLYPDLSAKERERAFARKVKAYFIQGIGAPLSTGEAHDLRSPDYDDWQLNGDLIFYNPVLDDALELSSLGIRVDEEGLLAQLTAADCLDRRSLPYHQELLQGKLPLTFGGGIGQSRICQFLLRKYHIGEVQCSIWPQEMIQNLKAQGILLL